MVGVTLPALESSGQKVCVLMGSNLIVKREDKGDATGCSTAKYFATVLPLSTHGGSDLCTVCLANVDSSIILDEEGKLAAPILSTSAFQDIAAQWTPFFIGQRAAALKAFRRQFGLLDAKDS
ncbi:hypothetical protein EON64_02235 [archaeon]|nr:MAG: hypothetical protein EON64_02235 [archaeon]